MSTTVTKEDLIAIRRLYGVNQYEVAQIIGVQQPSIARIENGYYKLSEDAGQRLLNHFKIDMGRLMFIRGIYSEFMSGKWAAV